jgi:hypothetical protein
LADGIIKFENRIWLGSLVSLHKEVFAALHSSALGGHSGAPATYFRIKQYFYWPRMKSDILQWVQACAICQQAKPDRVRYPGLLQPLPVPDSSWSIITMDFVEGLPPSGSYNAILVIIDKFSKYCHFLPLKRPFNARTVAKLFLDNVYKLHGFPKAIVSDRDKIFTSHFWKSLFKYAGVELRLSSAYHPQSDGQSERLNQCLETYLRCFVSSCPSKWSQWLSLAEFWYNTSLHSAIGRTPFSVLYGREARHFGLSIDSVDTPASDIDAWLQERALMHDLVRQHLIRAQQRMKRQADKFRSECQFQVNDMVYLKLQPYVQSSLHRRSNNKLSFKFFGPYRVLERIGAVAYKIELPSSSSIHNVFHVSQLKASHGNEQVSPNLPSALTELQVPLRILDHRISPGDHAVKQVLVEWSHMPATLSTWENYEDLRRRFPRAPAWGHAGSQGRANVKTVPVTADGPATGATAVDQDATTRPARVKKPNRLISGSLWA